MKASTSIQGLRVEVVEDEALIAEELSDRLSRLGAIVVDVVDSGEDAVESAKRLQPDLILMDIRLRGRMDGIQAAVAIRQSLSVPVIFLTAHSDAETLSRADVAEPAGYLLKPFHERDLMVALERALQRA